MTGHFLPEDHDAYVSQCIRQHQQHLDESLIGFVPDTSAFTKPENPIDLLIAGLPPVDVIVNVPAQQAHELWKPQTADDVLRNIMDAKRQCEEASCRPALPTMLDQLYKKWSLIARKSEVDALLNAPRKLKKQWNRNDEFVSIRSEKGRRQAREAKRQAMQARRDSTRSVT
jgi:hypothetical protein